MLYTLCLFEGGDVGGCDGASSSASRAVFTRIEFSVLGLMVEDTLHTAVGFPSLVAVLLSA